MKNKIFVTTGGKKYMTIYSHINQWMTRREFPALCTNALRHTAETAASLHSMDAKREVSSHLQHSLATGDDLYRVNNPERVLNQKFEVTNVLNNKRLIQRIEQDPWKYFAGMEEAPPIEEIQEVMCREVKTIWAL